MLVRTLYTHPVALVRTNRVLQTIYIGSGEEGILLKNTLLQGAKHYRLSLSNFLLVAGLDKMEKANLKIDPGIRPPAPSKSHYVPQPRKLPATQSSPKQRHDPEEGFIPPKIEGNAPSSKPSAEEPSQ